MILLIRHITTYLAITSKWFKFHYDSINSSDGIKEYTCKTWFKFHYDSINSKYPKELHRLMINLNSIMILLILCCLIFICIITWFKFHYDSINSLCSFTALLLNLNLNSIMILLIPVPKSSPYLSQKTSLFCRPLQNSTFLSCP